ncbi:MAG: fibronectin type III domain-containing protein, partial [Niastella sp.]|uniref:fibronectin type III domain-containing protein n=1 Tax=Niastella sp. TaxID=1869183 RepID=UPI003899C28A
MNRTHHIRMKQNRKVLKWFIASIMMLAALCQATNVQARFIYPVTASLQLIPPYSVYLPDYAAPGNDKLRVILTLNDLTQPSYTVRLRLKVEFNGKVIMQTDPAYRASPITILPGMPQIITGTQLNELLVSDHMQFMNGFNRENYERTKALPEGAYRICVTAYDYNRSDDVALSNDGCNIFFFQKNEAPLLNYPLCNTRVERKEPQFLTFTWSIRNTPSFVTGSMGTGYRFELFEVRPAGSNAEYIVRSSTPIYTATTDAAMLTYGPAMPKLLDSMQYVWRVQAFDKSGRDAYQNNGYSQSCVFTYGGVDPFVVNNIGKAELMGDALGERSGKWWWRLTKAQTVDGWNIQYRKKGDSASKGTAYSWNKQYIADTLLHLFNLEPDNSYEAQVQPIIKGITGFWSEIVPLHTFPKRVYECGKNDTANNGLGAAAAGQPLNSAVAGMVVRVGSFDMQMLDVQGGNGRFSGYGAVATPLLGMRLNVKFTDVQINDRLQLTQGEVVALSDGIDAWIKDRTKTNDDVNTIKDWKETMPDFDTASLATLKDFATELLGISPGIWTDTYVFTDQERKDVMAAIQEVQAAMKDLNDGDPSNDAAAEKKLRGALKKAEPMLEKLSDNIGKGVLVKLGVIRERLVTDALTDIKKQLEDDLKKLVLRLNEEQRAAIAMHCPHPFGYKEREGDKTKLEAKIKLIERLLTDQQARQLFEERIERNTTDDSYLKEQENVLKPLFDKEENKSKSSIDLLNAGNKTKVTGMMNKYLDDQVDAEQLLAGSSNLVADADNQSAFTVPKDKVYYLTPDGKPLDLDNFDGVVLIEPYGKGLLQYVVTGFSVSSNNTKITWVARGKDDKFLGYVNT